MNGSRRGGSRAEECSNMAVSVTAADNSHWWPCQEAVREAALQHFGLGLQRVQYAPASGYGSGGLHHSGVNGNHPFGNSPHAW